MYQLSPNKSCMCRLQNFNFYCGYQNPKIYKELNKTRSNRIYFRPSRDKQYQESFKSAVNSSKGQATINASQLRVDRMFLRQTLIEMGFRKEFVAWIDLLYKEPISKVNGHCSNFFRVERGVRQGDSLSPILFAISIEPLAEAIRQNTQIEGIADEGGSVHKIALFADDILLFIKNLLFQIPALMKCLHEYGTVSGSKINETKSQAMMISGTWPTQLNEMSPSAGPNKDLGIQELLSHPTPLNCLR